MSTIKCPKCGRTNSFNKFSLMEAAVLVCPNCSAEFGLTATLKRLPGEEGEEAPSPEEPEAPPVKSEPAKPEPEVTKKKETPPEGGEEGGEGEAVRHPVLRTKVLVCSDCRVEWLGVHADKCPSCDSAKVMQSVKSLEDRAQGAIDEVLNGVPTTRALNKMLGCFSKE